MINIKTVTNQLLNAYLYNMRTLILLFGFLFFLASCDKEECKQCRFITNSGNTLNEGNYCGEDLDNLRQTASVTEHLQTLNCDD